MAKMVYLMRYIKFAIFSIGLVFLFNFSYAQSLSEKEIKLSGIAAREFQKKIFSGDFDGLYRVDFDAEVKKSITNENFKKFLEKMTGTLGNPKNTILFNYKKINDEIIRVSFMSDFDRGVSVESYYIKMLPRDKYTLFRYEMTDPSKFTF
jgi:hypothetical protein